MRAHIWAAALVVAVGFGLRASAAPILATGSASSVAATTPSFFQSFTLPSFLSSGSKFSSFFPAMPSISHPTGEAFSGPIPFTNGQPNDAYFKLFGMQAAQHAH